MRQGNDVERAHVRTLVWPTDRLGSQAVSRADVLEAVVSVTAGGQLVVPPPVDARALVLEARVVQSGSQTVTPETVG